jgi:ArsR family transcriptional regulator
MLKLLSVDNRLKILCVLSTGGHCVCELMEHFEMSQSLISHHLADLKENELVIDKQTGKNVYYSLTNKGKKVFKLLNKISEEI